MAGAGRSGGGSSSGASRYGNMQGNAGGGEQIVPMGGNGQKPPVRGILSAISSIQQYSVIEGGGKDIPAEFLTIEGTLDYFKIGAKSGFNEGLILFICYPLMEFLVIPFFLKDPSHFIVLCFRSLPFFMIFFNTLLCGYVSKFYTGSITRKAINSLFTGRALSLFAKGCLIYVIYLFIARIGEKPQLIWDICLKTNDPQKYYYNFYMIQPKFIPAANRSFFFLVLAAFGPYGVVYIRDFARRMRVKRNQDMISSKMGN